MEISKETEVNFTYMDFLITVREKIKKEEDIQHIAILERYALFYTTKHLISIHFLIDGSDISFGSVRIFRLPQNKEVGFFPIEEDTDMSFVSQRIAGILRNGE
jgi:hypothetical protein